METRTPGPPSSASTTSLNTVKRMRSATLVAVASLVLSAIPAPAPAHVPSKPVLRIAKTRGYVKPHGWVSPWVRGSVRVTFSVLGSSGSYEKVADERVKLQRSGDHDGDGYRDATFESSFKRPKTGGCKVVVRYRHDGSVAKDVDEFDCAMPSFGTGEAELTAIPEGSRTIEVLLADTPDQQQYGLMYRRWLHPDKGMVFRFQQDGQGGFWMANTMIPLSIAYFDANGRIVDILDMEPCYEPPPGGCPTYNPDSPYRGALEVNQGAFTEWGIEEGDLIDVSE